MPPGRPCLGNCGALVRRGYCERCTNAGRHRAARCKVCGGAVPDGRWTLCGPRCAATEDARRKQADREGRQRRKSRRKADSSYTLGTRMPRRDPVPDPRPLFAWVVGGMTRETFRAASAEELATLAEGCRPKGGVLWCLSPCERVLLASPAGAGSLVGLLWTWATEEQRK